MNELANPPGIFQRIPGYVRKDEYEPRFALKRSIAAALQMGRRKSSGDETGSVPTYRQTLLAMHNGRTRYMKCPECGKRSWQKKVLTKEEH